MLSRIIIMRRDISRGIIMKTKMLLIALFSLLTVNKELIAQEAKVETTVDKGMALMEEAKKADKKQDPLKVDFDTDALNKEFATDPKLSTESFDQKDKNKKLFLANPIFI